MPEELGKLVLPKPVAKPGSPSIGQIVNDPSTGLAYIWDGIRWRPTDPNEVEHDATSHATAGTGNLEWTHTPVAKMIRGVLVHIAQNGRSSSTQQVSGVTYGGVAMTLIKERTEGGTRGVVSSWFLGDGIPQGAQTVKATVTGAAKKTAYCFSQTGPGPLRAISQTASAKSKTLAAGVTNLRESGVVYGIIGGPTAAITLSGTVAEQIAEENLNTAETPYEVEIDMYKSSVNGESSSQEFTWTTAAEQEYVALGTVVGLVRDFGLVTKLPERAGLGDTCKYIASSAQGIVWHLLYDGTATYPWVKIGGAPLLGQYLGAENLSTESTTPQTTNAPSVTIPAVAMEADVTWGANAIFYAAAGSQARMTLYNNGVSVGANGFTGGSGPAANVAVVRGERRLTIEASKVVQARYYRESGSGAVFFYSPYVRVDPVRVG